MKTISCILLSLIPMLAIGQCHPEMDGTLRVEVNGNSAILYNDTAWRPCDSQYDMEVRLVNGDTLKWVQIDQTGFANCLCHFNLSVTIDSLPPRLYFAKVYYSRHYQYDTCYIGTVRFRITEPEPFMAPIVADKYQSPCFPVLVNVGQVLPDISLKLFPNPSNELLNIETNLHGSKLITISDIGNRSIFEIETEEEKYVVDLSNLPNNMYFVTVRNDEKSQHAKFLKK